MSDENELETVKDREDAVATAISDASMDVDQCATDFETRHCIWPGQRDDGR